MNGNALFQSIPVEKRVVTRRLLDEICHDELQWAVSQSGVPSLFQFIDRGSPPFTYLHVLESVFENALVGLSLEVDCEKKSLAGIVGCYYLSCFARSQEDLESVLSPLALAMIIDQSVPVSKTITVEFLFSCMSQLKDGRKVDPLSLFALSTAILSNDDGASIRTILEFHAEDRRRWEAMFIHPIIPLDTGTSTELGIQMLCQLAMNSTLVSDGHSEMVTRIFQYFLGECDHP